MASPSSDSRTSSIPRLSDRLRALGFVEVYAKPVDLDEVLTGIRRILDRRRLAVDTGLIGESEAMREVLVKIEQIAPVSSTVLIEGESGTGKELVARALHRLSPRRSKPFIAVNIGALPETLLESELFGHEKGSFTGAAERRLGRFELANTGTLFLDEIGEAPNSTQVKLLRVLEQRELTRVGGANAIKVDVRVVAATNRPLREEVESGGFRADLYYRLNVLNIYLPPLRERREDIPLLVRAFIQEFSAAARTPLPRHLGRRDEDSRGLSVAWQRAGAEESGGEHGGAVAGAGDHGGGHSAAAARGWECAIPAGAGRTSTTRSGRDERARARVHRAEPRRAQAPGRGAAATYG